MPVRLLLGHIVLLKDGTTRGGVLPIGRVILGSPRCSCSSGGNILERSWAEPRNEPFGKATLCREMNCTSSITTTRIPAHRSTPFSSRVRTISDQGKTACPDALPWPAPECARLFDL